MNAIDLYLGQARRIEIDKDSTTILGGMGERRAIDARIAAIRREIEAATSDYDREKLQERAPRIASHRPAKVPVSANKCRFSP